MTVNTQPFEYWTDIIQAVITLIISNPLTSGFFVVMVITIFVDILGAVFNKDGTRKEGN